MSIRFSKISVIPALSASSSILNLYNSWSSFRKYLSTSSYTEEACTHFSSERRKDVVHYIIYYISHVAKCATKLRFPQFLRILPASSIVFKYCFTMDSYSASLSGVFSRFAIEKKTFTRSSIVSDPSIQKNKHIFTKIKQISITN